MRILVAGTVNYPALNGQAVFTENLAKGLVNQGHDVLSIFPSEKGKPYKTILGNVHIEAIKSNNLNHLHQGAYFSIFSDKAVLRILEAFKPDIVHIQDHFPLSRDVMRMSRRLGIKLVGTNHFMPENLAAYVPVLPRFKSLYNRIMWGWMLEVYNKLDVVTAQSMASADLLRARGLRVPVFPVSCGINLERFRTIPNIDRAAILNRYGLDPSRKTFLFVGRVDKEKCLDVLLHAISQLQRDDIQIAISGRGAALEELQALAKELNLGKRVHFTGFIPAEDLPALLNSVDIFTMPSEAELLSIATLEAMACARPVLLADAVALPELISEGRNGHKFRPGDAQDAARAVALLADHPENWPSMGQVSQEKARYHGIENTIKQYVTIYATVLGSPVSEASAGTVDPKAKLIRSKR